MASTPSPTRTSTQTQGPSQAPAQAQALAPKRDLLRMSDLGADLENVLDAARTLKRLNKSGHPTPLLPAKSAVLIFEKASTRTRVSFEVGLAKLGMTSTFLSTRDIQLGRGESIEDTALVLSRYADVLIYRANKNEDVTALAKSGTAPVINALDDLEHPCQILADLLTVLEHKGPLAGLKFLYVGDGNNMAHSYLVGCAMAGMHVTVVTPLAYAPDSSVVKEAEAIAVATGGSVRVLHDGFAAALDGPGRADARPLLERAFENQDVVATDTWVSMGDEDEKEERLAAFHGYTVTQELMARTNDAIFLHCLPAYYGYEVEKEVAHGPRSRVFDEAENRLWAQMAVLVWSLAPWKLAGLTTRET